MKILSNIAKATMLSVATLALSQAALGQSIPLGIPSGAGQTMPQGLDKRPVVTDASIDVGAYDPHGDFTRDARIKIEHLFLPWEDVELATLAIADDYARERGRTVLISVEPWSWSVDWRVTPEELLQGILAGRYDANMAAVCQAANGMESPVIIRWAQEMDETDAQFSWAQWPAESYVAAFRRVVTECRKHLTNARYMWSPKGNTDLQEFYPGDDYVDLIGLSVFGLQEYDRGNFGKDRTFAEALERGYELTLGYQKPIWVAELGYEGDEDYVRRWAQDAANSGDEFPNLAAVVYFNDREVYPWPEPYGLPDWRVVKEPAIKLSRAEEGG